MIVDREKAARELIAFYHEAGVDAVIGEEAIDRLAENKAAVLEGPDDHPPRPAATGPARERASHTNPPAGRTRVDPPQAAFRKTASRASRAECRCLESVFRKRA